MNRSYTKEQRRRALQVYKRSQSVTKTVRDFSGEVDAVHMVAGTRRTWSTPQVGENIDPLSV